MSSPKSHIEGVIFWDLLKRTDERGWLSELWRSDELDDEDLPEQTYISMTLPGVVRGPHEHKDQTDLFCFLGPGDFELHLWEPVKLELPDMSANAYHEVFRVGEHCCPVAVLVPPGVIHAYKNISDKPGFVVNCPNRLYAGPGKRYPVDEIRHENGDGAYFYRVE